MSPVAQDGTVKGRSPNYPGLTLGEALDAVRSLYPAAQAGPLPALAAARAWGYTSVSGPVRRRLAALRQYGLIEQKRGGPARLSGLALTLLLRSPASSEYRTALQETAQIGRAHV